MPSSDVKSFSWKCRDCVEQESRSPGFQARTLAITEVIADGNVRTTVWMKGKKGKPDKRSAAERWHEKVAAARQIPGGVLRAKEGWYGVTIDLDRRRMGLLYYGRVLGPDEVLRIPCGREHGGYRTAGGTWRRGVPGHVTVSSQRFVDQVKRIATA
jgi:hypothetical protein